MHSSYFFAIFALYFICNKMKLTTLYISVFSLLLTLSACSDKKLAQVEESPVDTIPMMVSQIQKCSRLYTAEFQVHKIITHNDKKQFQGSILSKNFTIDLPLGKRMIAIPMDATLKAYIDFSDFSDKNIRRNGNKIEVFLPDPKITLTSTKINHQEIKQYVAMTRSNFSDEELTVYEKQGRDAVIKDIPEMGIIKVAQESAARAIIPVIVKMGYQEKDITVSFRKQFGMNDIRKLLEGDKEKK